MSIVITIFPLYIALVLLQYLLNNTITIYIPALVPFTNALVPFTNTASGKEKGKRKQVQETSTLKKSKASWDDSKVKCFIDLCLEEVVAGNKPSTVLNKDGYEKLERKFKGRTGFSYTRAQLKNHWDTLKKDWQIWNILRKQTCKGWSKEKNTYSLTYQLWEIFAKVRT